MKASRGVSVAGLSAALVAAGWAAGSGFLTPTQSASAQTSTDTSATDGSTSQASSSGSSSTSGSSSGSSSSSSASGSTDQPSSSSSATSSDQSSGSSGTFDGDAVNTRYGTFQVEITVKDGTITDVSLLRDGLNDGRSQQINNYAIPRLTKEVLSAQSANVQAVSGASFTSYGFINSVASAIDAAGL